MSNQDFDYKPDPAEIISLGQRAAIGNVATSVDDDPEKAARAYDISKATALPPSVVNDDLEHYEGQLKTSLSTSLVRNNPQLQAYVNSHPLAAKISNDDYGQLDKASKSISDLNIANVPGVGPVPMGVSPSVTQLARNFKAGFGDEPLGAWGAQDEQSREFIRRYPYSAALAGLEGLPLEVPARILSGLATMVFGPEKAQAILDPGVFASLEGIGPPGAIAAGVGEALTGLIRAARAGAPWLREGEVPPVGIDPLLDKAHAEQAKVDGKALGDALKESVASSTRERAPDLYADFVRQHTDAKIGISADAIRDLYGDKVPAPDDGLLGWVPKLQEQLQTAEATGGDVDVPLADYLAKVDPKVANDLADHVRVRPGGLTVEEAKELPPPQDNTVVGYHGASDVIDQFDQDKTRLGRGIFFADNPELASKFAEGRATDSDSLRIFGEDDPTEIKKWVTQEAGDAEGARIGALLDKASSIEGTPEWQTLAREITEELKKVSSFASESEGQAPNISKVKLDLGRTHIVDLGGRFDWDKEREAINYAKEHGYDSVTFTNSGEKGN